MRSKYKMTISRLTVDKLGVKLYDRVSAVMAELVANSYDGDATEVKVSAPMGHILATKDKGQVLDKGYTIEITDNGVGMTPEEINNFYLPVGKERRIDPQRGDRSKKFNRKVMGRKGVGKLAPFGVCQHIEVITSGGEKIKGKNESGIAVTGYQTAHLILRRDLILSDTDKAYYPEVGKLDETIRPNTGTTLRLSVFDKRRVPTIDQFERQFSQRFGISTANWQVILLDSTKDSRDPDCSRRVGHFTVPTMDSTEIKFKEVKQGKAQDKSEYSAVDSEGNHISDLKAGFTLEDRFYPITGWVGYSKKPYRDDLMAGVRIYCRGKIAAQSHIFNLKAGFTGEYDIRSYLVGELHADWLDEEEDLIRTDRRDILWSSEIGQEFEKWGQTIVKRIGSITREPRRKKAWEIFKELSNIDKVVEKTFPDPDQKSIRDNTMEIAKSVARTAREDELRDPQQLSALVQLSLLLGPHITLDKKLREAAEDKASPLAAITGILRTARIAELSSFGQIADDRVKVIRRVEDLKDDPDTLEGAFQGLIESAPWLVDPQWSPITANQTFATLKTEFQKFYKEKTGKNLILDDFSDPYRRVDFVMSNQDNVIEMIEIKQPKHALQNDEMVRINSYLDLIDQFLSQPGNQDFREVFSSFHLTLVCDKIALTSVHKRAFDSFKHEELLTHLTWKAFLLRTRRMHEAFLKEAERQKRMASRKPKP